MLQVVGVRGTAIGRSPFFVYRPGLDWSDRTGSASSINIALCKGNAALFNKGKNYA